MDVIFQKKKKYTASDIFSVMIAKDCNDYLLL